MHNWIHIAFVLLPRSNIHQIEQLKTQRQLCYEFVRVCWAVTAVIMLYIINGILYIWQDCKLCITLSLSFSCLLFQNAAHFAWYAQNMYAIELNAFIRKQESIQIIIAMATRAEIIWTTYKLKNIFRNFIFIHLLLYAEIIILNLLHINRYIHADRPIFKAH